MKELSIEQKAKAYDNALEIAKGLYAKDAPDSLHLKRMFPQLKESEDEKVRKELLLDIPKVFSYDKAFRYIAYLEKQGEQKSTVDNFESALKHIMEEAIECGDIRNLKADAEMLMRLVQKPADKIEPKFKVDDWVVTDMNNIVQIKAVNNGYYTIDNGSDFNMYYVDKCWHLWTIQDAKNGDVLSYSDSRHTWLCIFKELKNQRCYDYCSYRNKDEIGFWPRSNWNYDKTLSYKPATKEQRNLLFQKMKEAGYEWDSEKKELKKIEQKSTEWEPQTGDTFRKKGTTSPTYHLCNKQEDGITFGFVENREVGISGGKITIFALKNDYELVERPKSIEDVVAEEFNRGLQTKVGQKPAWSEEDEVVVKDIYDKLNRLSMTYVGNESIVCQEDIKWLKFLKDRYAWKPSDEQMEALLYKVNAWDEDSVNGQNLKSLYQDLKKLKD